MDLELLLKFGLHKNDLKVYEALVCLGRTKSGPLMAQASIGSSRLYASLNALIQKGLVSYSVRNNIRYYKPEEVSALIAESKKSTQALEKLAEKISSLKQVVPERNETNVFEGYHGFRRAFLEHVERMSRGEELRIIGFGSNAPRRKALSEFINEINVLAMKKKCRVHILFDKEIQAKGSFPKEADVHFLPSSYFGPTA